MQAYQGKWSDLQIGSYMRDQTGVVWKVTKTRDFHLLVENRDGDKKHLKPRDPNTPVTLMGATEEEAARVLREKLGAQVIARRAAGQTGWLCPAFPLKGAQGAIQEARSHLFMAHGIYTGDVKRMDGPNGMTACHDEDHASPGHGYQEHSHP
jgi:hypothetical protein